jgi:Kef-type K+ transport system membrane component KefB
VRRDALEGGLPAVIGAFHLGAIVDETRSAPELIESNNRITGALITFGE